jgi:pyruvate formate lyase activating enzyme
MSSGIVFDIKHYAIHDGPGIRTTVFLKGCPLRCAWCHNPESQDGQPEQVKTEVKVGKNSFEEVETIGKRMSVDQVMKEITRDIPFHNESGGGVTFSGGEPLYQPEFLKELLRECRNAGIHTCVDTTGYSPPSVIRDMVKDTNLFLYDLKIMDDTRHVEYTGVSNELSLSNLSLLVRKGAGIIIRFPVIPGHTDQKENIESVIEKLVDLNLRELDLLRYHLAAGHKYCKLGKPLQINELSVPDVDTMHRIRQLFLAAGINARIDQ